MRNLFLHLIYVCVFFANAQQSETIPLYFDTSGYANSNNNIQYTTFDTPVNNDTIPTIKSEMNVSEGGALTYMIPVEVMKGVNGLQPNIAMLYNSQSGMGQAGWGWNISGLSMITRGGKSKAIDGIAIGPQFNNTDPFYLDGQRLLHTGNNIYVTEKYSKIKITNYTTGEYSFMIQYTDGKIAKYKEIVTGQHYISVLQNEFNQEVHYTYQVFDNVPYIQTISYGGTAVNNDLFKVLFIFKNKIKGFKSFRNGVTFKNTKILERIEVSSTLLTENAGLFRKYFFTHDLIHNNANERLIKVEVQNEFGEKLKPLNFGYNTSANAGIETTGDGISTGDSFKGLGSVVMGDFYGTGKPTPLYEQKTDSGYTLKSANTTHATYTQSKDYYNGRCVYNNKFTERDQLITYHVEYIGEYDENLNNVNDLVDRLTFNFKDLISNQTKTVTFDLQGSYYTNSYVAYPNDPYNNDIINTDYIRNKENKKLIVGDYNNDGLTDLLVIINSEIYDPISNSFPQKIYFAEIGKLNGVIVPTLITGPFIYGNSHYSIEYDGDNVPEIFAVTATDYTQNYRVYKLNLLNNTISLLSNLNYGEHLSNFTAKTPIIFGDYNGDGLTDFMTPTKCYSFNDSTAAKELHKMNTEQLTWWQYIATGTGFQKTLLDLTSQKIAYLSNSQRNVIKNSSFWEKLWDGKPDEYQFTEYGSTNVMAMDINNDGKSDLVTFSKYGTIKHNADGNLNNIQVNNFSPSFYISNPLLSQFQIQYVDQTYANKIRFHIATPNSQGDITWQTSPTQIPLHNSIISPLSLYVPETDTKSLNVFKNTILVFDPGAKSQTRFSIKNDDFIEGRLQQVNNGSSVVQKVEYLPMDKSIDGAKSCYLYKPLNLDYPYFVHQTMGTHYLVNKNHTLTEKGILTKEYRYENAIQHLDGKGFLGFQKTYISDTYESELKDNTYYRIKDIWKGMFWKTNIYDPTFENALVESTYGSLDATAVFSRTTNQYQKIDKGNHRYLIINTVEHNKDFLQDVFVTKTYQHDTAGDLLIQQILTNFNNQSSAISKYEYKPEFYNGQKYFFGKIEKTEETAIKNGDTFTTKQEYYYNTNGTVYQSKKYGNNTPAITTDYIYHTFGEKQSETLFTQGMNIPLTTNYLYEPTNRYLWKITTPDNMVSTTIVNALGRITSEVSPLGHTTTYKYDNWGNVKETKDYLGIKTFVTKLPRNPDIAGSKYGLSTQRQGGTTTIAYMDEMDRNIYSKTQSINGKWIAAQNVYDLFGRKTKTSQPHFTTDTPQWNTVEYDMLNRPIKQTAYNGKVITTCYEKLKVTVEDGHKKTSKTLDAQGNTISHTDSGGTIHYSYYPNGSLKETNYGGIKTKIKIDGWGNKTELNDPSAGIYKYEYDNLSRITKETNPKNGTTIYTYDNWGRPLTENTNSPTENTAISKNYEYDDITNLPTIVSGTYNGATYTYTTFYNDPHYRMTGKKEEAPHFTITSTNSYDTYGRANETEIKTVLINPAFTTISKTKNVYDTNGILIRQNDGDTNTKIWEITDVTAAGMTKTMDYGNGYTLTNLYNATTQSLERITHKRGTAPAILDTQFNFDVLKGVLNSRNNLVFNKNETFAYDNLDRLLTETVNGIIAQEYTYDPRGRMTSSTAMGKYNYNEQDYRLQSINFNTNGNQINTSRGFADISYTSFKNPNEIFLAGKDRISYDFSILKTRSVAYYGSLDANKLLRPNRKFYSADKAVEIVKEGNITKVITYITGDPYSANYMRINTLNGSTPISNKKYYLHRDHQGTILAISEANTTGSVVERRYFDAWGNLKEARIGTSNTTILPTAMGWVNTLLIDRGYTGHEHLKTVGLIHMNGRIYDPVLRRFLSPDNYVQDPYNTQNYNRFGYVYNNPLLYTDPSGELGFLAAVVIAVAVSVVTKVISNLVNGVTWWHGIGKSATQGAIMGAITFGIGSAATSAFTNFYSQAAFQAGMHGMVGGLGSSIEGGSFMSGFAAGAISSIVSSGIKALGTNFSGSGAYRTADGGFSMNKFGKSNLYKVATLAAGATSGGISASIAGGKFIDGFKQGLLVSGLNHLAHETIDGDGGGSIKKQTKPTKGENINLFDKNNSEADKNAYEIASMQSTEDNTLKIFAHGYNDNIDGMLTNEVHDFLLKNSDLYKYSFENGTKINVEVYACQTGNVVNGKSIVLELSRIHKTANFLAASGNIVYQSGQIGTRINSYFYNFNNGNQTFSSKNYFFTRNLNYKNQFGEKASAKF